MRAATQHRYGSPDVLELTDIATPTPADDQVLIRVRAASVNPLDWHEITGKPYLVRLQGGVRAPKQLVPGTDVAGVVEAVGRDATRFRPGDEVFGMCTGAFAEYVAVRDLKLARKPANIGFEQAAAVPVAALTALQALRDRGHVEPGHRVLVNGASGGVGTFAVQLAKAFGAEVTGVCRTANAEMVRSLGADHVVDYTREDYTRAGRQYDLVLDVAGTHSLAARRRALTRTGTLVFVGGPKTNDWVGPLGTAVRGVVGSRFRRRKMVAFLAKNSREDLETLAGLLEAGTIRSVVERSHPLQDVAEAVRQVGGGHSRAKVVVTME